MKAIILAAGKGERMLPLTRDTPKPMLPINGKPVLEYLVRLCKKHGVRDLAINTSYFPANIIESFQNGLELGVNIRYSFEKTLLGTAGALNSFRNFFTEPFFVIYGDNITDLDLTKMTETHRKNNAQATLYLYREPMVDEETGPGCVVISDTGKIEQIVEKPDEIERKRLTQIPANRRLFNAGVYFLQPEVLDLIPRKGHSDFAADILPRIVRQGRAYAFQQDCYFKEIGQIQRYEQAKQDIESGRISLNI